MTLDELAKYHDAEARDTAHLERDWHERAAAVIREAMKALNEAFDFLGGVDDACELRDRLLPLIAARALVNERERDD